MGPERLQQIDRLVRAAMQRGQGERSAYLREACGGDESLYREVQGRMAQGSETEHFMRPARRPALDGESATGGRLGPYEILKSLGAGGMGEVYLAHDTRLDRSVAIKLLPAHLARDPVARERLRREALAASSAGSSFYLQDFRNQRRGRAAVLRNGIRPRRDSAWTHAVGALAAIGGAAYCR